MGIPTRSAPEGRHRQRSRSANRRGFTLIEVLCAVFITVVGLVSAFYLVALSTVSNTDARNMTQAYQACQQEIELLRNIPYANLQSVVLTATMAGTPEARFLKANVTPDASRPGDAGYPGLVPSLANLNNGRGGLIVTNDSGAGDQVKHVTAVVRWTDRGGEERSAVMGTLIALGGMDPR